MREQTCCFTGHRNIAASECPALEKRLEEEIVHLIQQGVRYFGAGGARGFDTMAAEAVLRLREEYPDIRLILVLPNRQQALTWGEGDKMIYNDILRRADKVVYTTKPGERDCMLKRNRHLVDNSAICVCYWYNHRHGLYGGIREAIRAAHREPCAEGCPVKRKISLTTPPKPAIIVREGGGICGAGYIRTLHLFTGTRFPS